MLTLAYANGQGWKPVASGQSEEEGVLEEGRCPARPVHSSQACKVCRSHCPRRRGRRDLGSFSRLGDPPSLSGLGTGTRSTALGVVSRGSTEVRGRAGRTAGMCLFQRCQDVS